MSESSEKKSLGPHFIIVGILLVVILAVVFWPSDDEPEPVVTPEPEVTEPEVTTYSYLMTEVRAKKQNIYVKQGAQVH